jgi:hypothetical protein
MQEYGSQKEIEKPIFLGTPPLEPHPTLQNNPFALSYLVQTIRLMGKSLSFTAAASDFLLDSFARKQSTGGPARRVLCCRC